MLPTRAASSFLPRLASPTFLSPYRFTSLYMRQISLPFLPRYSLAVPAISLNLPSIPDILEGIWEGILKAVPKKKTSHSKKRHRQMAGKALKDVNNLCKCPVCGGTKRMHHLCETCMNSKNTPFFSSGGPESALTRICRDEEHDGQEEPGETGREDDRKDDRCGMKTIATNVVTGIGVNGHANEAHAYELTLPR